MKRIAIYILLGATFAGCTTVRPSMSYVAPEITANDAQMLAVDAAQWLSRPLPPARTTLVLNAPATPQSDVMTPVLTEQLRATGYGVVQVSSQQRGNTPPEGVTVRYLVSPLRAGILMRLQYQNVEAARFYQRGTDGSLVGAAPFTVREAGQ